MRRRLLSFAAVAIVAGCGGEGGKPLAETARPCLAKLGTYVHHSPRFLPVPDPDSHAAPPPHLSNPPGFEEYGEVGFPPSGKGANSVQVLIFGDGKLARRVFARMEQLPPTRGPAGPFGFPAIDRVVLAGDGHSLWIWSSTESATQETAVEKCLGLL